MQEMEPLEPAGPIELFSFVIVLVPFSSDPRVLGWFPQLVIYFIGGVYDYWRLPAVWPGEIPQKVLRTVQSALTNNPHPVRRSVRPLGAEPSDEGR